MRTTYVPVLVAGCGPVGLSTAMFLAHWGVSVLAIDKRDPASAPPRASSSLRTLELFRAIGLGPALAEAGWLGGPLMRMVFKETALGDGGWHSELPPAYSRRLETCSPVDARQSLTQREIHQTVLPRLLRDGGAVRLGLRLLDFTAGESGVRARVVDTETGEEEEIRADYLIGADGAGSDVRRRLGIDVPDRAVVTRLNTAFFRADLGKAATEWEAHLCFVHNEKVTATLLSKNGRDQWSSHILDYPGKPDALTGLSETKTIELLRAAIGDDTLAVELQEVNAWEAAIGIASAFRQGRVFLAGDAAHVQTSAGGLGMNTGIQDGHNLAWKLASVLKGQSAESLLDTYEPERRAAAEASQRLSRRMHQGYQDPASMAETVAADYLRGMMFYRYESSAVLDPAPADPDPLRDQAVPGCRFPHRWIDTVSTLDLIGTQWTLFTGREGTPWLSTDVGVAIQGHHLSDFGDITGLAPDGAVLVRPDGFVAWRTEHLGADPSVTLRGALDRIPGRGISG